MQKKTIRKVLNQKINEWISSINDKDVRKLVKSNTIVTGGSIASMLLKEPVNDYDVYFRDKETVLAVANYYAKKFNEINDIGKVQVIDYDDMDELSDESLEGRVCMRIKSSGVAESIESLQAKSKIDETEENTVQDIVSDENTLAKDKYRPSFISENAITLTDKLQVMVRFYGEPEEIHANYDFIHACNYYDHGDNNLVLKPEANEALLQRRLYYVGSLYPVCSIFRAKKFIKRDWQISAGELLKIMFQISKLDLSDINVLREQLTGVDQAYFSILINRLEQNTEKLDQDYLFNLIDELWND